MAERGGSGRRGDFLKLWAGQTVSLFGSQILAYSRGRR